MIRPWFWSAYLMLVAGWCAAEEPHGDLRTILTHMPAEQREPFLHALQLDDGGDFAGAVSTLQPFVDSGKADVYVSTLLGALYARARQWQGAEQAYEAALKALGSKSKSFTWNVEESLGEALLQLERFKEASHHLELALHHCSSDADDDNLHELAGEAYEGAGQPSLAVQAYVDAVLINPFLTSGWLAIDRLMQGSLDRAHASTRLMITQSQLRLEDVGRVAHAVNSGRPLSDDDRFAYVHIADAMYQAGRVKSGGRFLRAAFRDYLNREWPEAEVRLNVEKTMGLLSSFGFLSRLTVGTQYHLLSLLAVDRVDKGLYSQVISTIYMISALRLTKSQKQEMTEFLEEFYSSLFAAVSFDPATGRPRFVDPDDYLGPCMGDFMETQRAQADQQKDPAELPAKDADGKCLIKYGTLNFSEDLATTVSDVYSGQDFTGPLLGILKERIRLQKFDVPVKATLAKLTDGRVEDVDRGDVAGMSLMDLDRAIAAAGPGKVHEVTLQAFEAAKQAPQLFQMFAIKATPEHVSPDRKIPKQQ